MKKTRHKYITPHSEIVTINARESLNYNWDESAGADQWAKGVDYSFEDTEDDSTSEEWGQPTPDFSLPEAWE